MSAPSKELASRASVEITQGTETTTQSAVSLPVLVHATVLLGCVNLFHALDRAALSVLIEPIKADLELSDTQLGVLTGFAFSLTYALFGIPLARLADTRNRVKLLSICLAVWSAATALAGLAQSFIQLALTRVMVGIGEAGGGPSSVSMLGDFYAPENRSRGMSWYQLGGAAGGTLGLALVGVLADYYGWRVALFALGLPGLFLSIVLVITLREPLRGLHQGAAGNFDADINWHQAIRQVLRRRTILHIYIAYGIGSFGGAGLSVWFGAFFMRSHALSLSEVGALLGGVVGLCTILGVMLGAALGPGAVKKDRRWELWWPGFASLITVPTWILTLYLDDIFLVCAMLALTIVVTTSFVALVLTSIQSVLPAHLRGMGMAGLMFASNLLGVGAGPLLIGLLSDALTQSLGDEALRYAMIISTSIIGWAAIHFFLAAKHLREELVL